MTDIKWDKIKEAVDMLGPGYDVPEVERVINALGLTVENPKPAPGVYLAPIGGHPRPVLVEQDGDLWWINDEGKLVQGMARTVEEVDGLTPARVVPAEPVELDEDEALMLFALHAKGGWGESALAHSLVLSITNTVNAALAKYGHGVA